MDDEKITTTEDTTANTSPVQDFWKNLAALLKVKTIVTLVVVAVFAILALRGGLQPDTVMTIVTMVVAFYFGTQTEGKSNGK